MSAWLVTNHHVNALAAFAADQALTNRPADVVALELWTENRSSLRHRYADADTCWTELPQLERVFTFDDVTLPSLWHVLKGAQCYAYQACEHPGWQRSVSHELVTRIEARAREMLGLGRYDDVSRHHGYEDAPWGLEA